MENGDAAFGARRCHPDRPTMAASRKSSRGSMGRGEEVLETRDSRFIPGL